LPKTGTAKANAEPAHDFQVREAGISRIGLLYNLPASEKERLRNPYPKYYNPQRHLRFSFWQ